MGMGVEAHATFNEKHDTDITPCVSSPRVIISEVESGRLTEVKWFSGGKIHESEGNRMNTNIS